MRRRTKGGTIVLKNEEWEYLDEIAHILRVNRSELIRRLLGVGIAWVRHGNSEILPDFEVGLFASTDLKRKGDGEVMR